jgi:hypothetical protein
VSQPLPLTLTDSSDTLVIQSFARPIGEHLPLAFTTSSMTLNLATATLQMAISAGADRAPSKLYANGAFTNRTTTSCELLIVPTDTEFLGPRDSYYFEVRVLDTGDEQVVGGINWNALPSPGYATVVPPTPPLFLSWAQVSSTPTTLAGYGITDAASAAALAALAGSLGSAAFEPTSAFDPAGTASTAVASLAASVASTYVQNINGVVKNTLTIGGPETATNGRLNVENADGTSTVILDASTGSGTFANVVVSGGGTMSGSSGAIVLSGGLEVTGAFSAAGGNLTSDAAGNVTAAGQIQTPFVFVPNVITIRSSDGVTIGDSKVVIGQTTGNVTSQGGLTATSGLFGVNQGSGVGQVTIGDSGGALVADSSLPLIFTSQSGGQSVISATVTTQENIIAYPNSSGIVVLDSASQALTNKTINGNTITTGAGTLTLGTNTATATKSGTIAMTSDTALLAPLASPTFTGVPLAPTPTAADNTTKIATTAFVSAAVSAAVAGLLNFKGMTDCSGNPNYPAGTKGDAYIVSVAGKIGGASGTAVDVGDWYVCTTTNAGGTEAAVGADWGHMEHNLVGALLASNNLSELSGTAATARSNIGAFATAGGTFGGAIAGTSGSFSGNIQAATFTGPLSGTASAALAAPVSGLTGAGTGVVTALAIGVGTAGAVIVNGGALGTPSGGVATNLTGTASGLTAGAVAVANLTGTGTSVITLLGTAADGSQANGPGYRGIPQNSQSGTSYSLILSDNDQHVYHPTTATSTASWIIPANSVTAFPIGSAILLFNDSGGGVITLSINSDTLEDAKTGSLGSRTLTAPCMSMLLKVASTRWTINGGQT